MFTGIIEEVAVVSNVENLGGGRRLTIKTPLADELKVDQSISINGACQTVVAHDAQTFTVEAVEETLEKTTFGGLKAGSRVNLERALQAGARMDGHFVQGHVDNTGTITGVETKAHSWLYHIRFDPDCAKYIIPVGSIAVDGISLTVARLEGDQLTVSIIPHTYEHTIVDNWEAGTAVNLEYDLIGKYVARQTGSVKN